MTSDFESYITARLRRLEAQNRRLKWLGALLLLLTASQMLVGLYLLLPVGRWLGLPRTVEASRFVLVDEQGRVRATLAMDQGPQLELATEEGQGRAFLWVNHDGAASVTLLDNKNGAGRVAILSAYDDGAELTLMDEKGPRVVVTAGKDKKGLELFDDLGKPVAKP